jgi:hypothetical protein
VGKEVYDILHQSSVICQLSGVAEVSTVWGMIKIPFEKRGKIDITKSASIQPLFFYDKRNHSHLQ